jgi:hypothetical protein
MATSAQYTAQPILEYSQLTTGDASRTAPTNAVEITAGPNATAGAGVGKRITKVTCHATGNTVNGMLRFFVSLDNGTTKRLILEKPKPNVTPSSSVSAVRIEVAELVGMMLPGGTANKLFATTSDTETWNVIVESALL